MADDKPNVGEPGRSLVNGSEDYEVRYFAEKHGITRDYARELIGQRGNCRETLDPAADRLRMDD